MKALSVNRPKSYCFSFPYFLVVLMLFFGLSSRPSIGQDWTEIVQQYSSDPASSERFGYSVGIDGDFIIVGVPYDFQDETGENPLAYAGSAFILYKDQGQTDGWNIVKKIDASDRSEGDNFGFSVDISGDYAIVGAFYDDHDATGGNEKLNSGSAYIFYKNQGGVNNWGELKKIVASDRDRTDEFGRNVAISGSFAIAGAAQEDEDNDGLNFVDQAGSVYLFEKDLGGIDNWGELKKLVASKRYFGVRFGGDGLDISGDYILVGTLSDDMDASELNPLGNAGAAHIYYKDMGGVNNWGHVKKFVASDRSSASAYGRDAAICGDYAIIGADGAEAAYIYSKNFGGTNNWGEVKKIVSEDIGERFGVSVALSSDYALVGNHGNSDQFGNYIANKVGSAYFFGRNLGGADNWGKVSKVLATCPQEDDYFSNIIALSNDYAVIPVIYGNSSAGKVSIFKNVMQANGIGFSNIDNNGMTINWNNGNGDARVVFVKKVNSSSEFFPIYPEKGINYAANTIFGLGTELTNCSSSGFYCVYNGTGNLVTISDLDSYSDYEVMVCDYTGSSGQEIYYNTPTQGNPLIQRTRIDISGVNINVNVNRIYSTTTLMEYSLNSTNGTDGTWTSCSSNSTSVSFSAGSVYVREILFPENYSLVATIASPASSPDYTINYPGETTQEAIPSTIEYNFDNNFTLFNNSGTNAVVVLTPGTDIYFRVKATASNLPSDIQSLDVPVRVSAPSYSIDYLLETTNELIIVEDEYSVNSNMSSAVDGSGVKISVIPGQDFYFRKKATAGSFAGNIQSLVIPFRTSAPEYSIDFILGYTIEAVASNEEYSENSDMSSTINGVSQRLKLVPGTDFYFRVKGTISSFSGLIQHLIVPAMPAAPIVSLSDKNSTTAKFKKSSDGSGSDVDAFDGMEFSTDGGSAWQTITELSNVDASGLKTIIVRVKSTISSFVSEITENIDLLTPVVSTSFVSGCPGLDDEIFLQSNTDNGFVYLILETEDQANLTELESAVLAGNGSKSDVIVHNTDIAVSTSDLPDGIYNTYAVDESGLMSVSGSTIIIYPLPYLDLGEDIIICEGTNVTLDAGSGFSEYTWSPSNESSQSIQVTASGTYGVSVMDANSCSVSDQLEITYNIPYSGEEICMVMIDPSTEKNMIIWEKTPDVGISAYQVWKVAGIENVLVEEVLYDDTSMVIDLNSTPTVKSDAYFLVAIDSCGNSSDYSPWHKPFLLQSSLGTDDVINLNWEPYLVDGNEYLFESIVIYRGSDSLSMEAIDNIAAGIGSNSYVDQNPLLNVKAFYRIGGEKSQACDPNNVGAKKGESGPFIHSLSNLEDNRITTGIFENETGSTISIQPNPMNTQSLICWKNDTADKYYFRIIDLRGSVILERSLQNKYDLLLNRDMLESGYYVIEIYGKTVQRGKLVVK